MQVPSFSKDHCHMEAPFIKELVHLNLDGYMIIKADLRFRTPNGGEYLEPGEMHSIEHLMATALYELYPEQLIDFSMMACQTGAYCEYVVGVKENSHCVDWKLVFEKALSYKEVPGVAINSCGNYLLHDYDKAIASLKAFYDEVFDE